MDTRPPPVSPCSCSRAGEGGRREGLSDLGPVRRPFSPVPCVISPKNLCVTCLAQWYASRVADQRVVGSNPSRVEFFLLFFYFFFQLVRNCAPKTTPQVGFEPTTLRLAVRDANHCTTRASGASRDRLACVSCLAYGKYKKRAGNDRVAPGQATRSFSGPI